MKKILLVLLIFLGAATILMISMSRATLEVMKRDEREGRLRVIPIFVGDMMVYKIPETNMLPSNIFYVIKEMRDWLWTEFSNGDEREIKRLIVLADKKISEAKTLSEREKYGLALKAGMKAIDKLKYANGLVSEMKNQSSIQKQLFIQIRDATLAYEEIVKGIGRNSGVENREYLLLQKNINDFKEEQIKKEMERAK